MRVQLASGASSFCWGSREFVAGADGIAVGVPEEAAADVVRHGHAVLGDPTAAATETAAEASAASAEAAAEDGGKKKGK